MGMTIVETLFDVGQKIFGLKIELAKARQNRKQQVAEFLAAIAQTIEEANAARNSATCCFRFWRAFASSIFSPKIF